MGKGDPAPNIYKLPSTFGYKQHDPTKYQNPAFTIRSKLKNQHKGLGPGQYQLYNKTRFGQIQPSGVTMGTKYCDPKNFISPGPVHYRPERCSTKPNPPRFTMGKLTQLPRSCYIPAPNTYKISSGFNLQKQRTAAITFGQRVNASRHDFNPAPNTYGPVKISVYKKSGQKYTMGKNTALPGDNTQKPAPNLYFPKLKYKETTPKFSFGRREPDARVIYFTLDDIRQ